MAPIAAHDKHRVGIGRFCKTAMCLDRYPGIGNEPRLVAEQPHRPVALVVRSVRDLHTMEEVEGEEEVDVGESFVGDDGDAHADS
jgi:hypothetical protein